VISPPPKVAAASGAALLRDLTHDDAAMLAVALDELEALIQVPIYVYSQKKGLIMLSDRTFFFCEGFFGRLYWQWHWMSRRPSFKCQFMCIARQNALLIYWIVRFFFPCFIFLAANILAVAFDVN